MVEVVTVGLDIAKSVFQVHGVDAGGRSRSVGSFGGLRCWRSSPSCRPV
jgi:hypothetical protein